MEFETLETLNFNELFDYFIKLKNDFFENDINLNRCKTYHFYKLSGYNTDEIKRLNNIYASFSDENNRRNLLKYSMIEKQLKTKLEILELYLINKKLELM